MEDKSTSSDAGDREDPGEELDTTFSECELLGYTAMSPSRECQFYSWTTGLSPHLHGLQLIVIGLSGPLEEQSLRDLLVRNSLGV